MPLSKLLVPFLKLSNNMHAEALTKAMGRARGRPGSWAERARPYTTGYLKSLGVPMAGVTLTDGSGLTRRNKLTPRALATTAAEGAEGALVADLLRGAAGRRQHQRLVGGTLRHRMNDDAGARTTPTRRPARSPG